MKSCFNRDSCATLQSLYEKVTSGVKYSIRN